MPGPYPKINISLLNVLIYEKYDDKAAFGRALDIPRNQIYNWCNGACSPPVDKVIMMADALDVSPTDFYIPGSDYVKSGIQAALTRWSRNHQVNNIEGLSNNEALFFTRITSPDTLDEIQEDYTRVDEITLPS